MSSLDGLPGAELVGPGLRDLAEGRETAEALLVAMVASRLAELGIDVPPARFEEPELALYRLLCEEAGAGAYSRYNSLRRRLDRFVRALARERRRRGSERADQPSG